MSQTGKEGPKVNLELVDEPGLIDRTPTCGCKIAHDFNYSGNALPLDPDIPIIIQFCTVHSAANELLEAIKLARWHLMTKARKDPEERKVVEALSEAYAKAGG